VAWQGWVAVQSLVGLEPLATILAASASAPLSGGGGSGGRGLIRDCLRRYPSAVIEVG
jgi:hypothetical protein